MQAGNKLCIPGGPHEFVHLSWAALSHKVLICLLPQKTRLLFVPCFKNIHQTAMEAGVLKLHQWQAEQIKGGKPSPLLVFKFLTQWGKRGMENIWLVFFKW